MDGSLSIRPVPAGIWVAESSALAFIRRLPSNPDGFVARMRANFLLCAMAQRANCVGYFHWTQRPVQASGMEP